MAERGKPGPGPDGTGKAKSRCAICGRPVVAEFRPFCSRRCADADLGRWLTGEYRIPGPAQEEADPEGDEDDL